MSSTNGNSTLKSILQVFAILFSIVLVPALIAIIPAGGAVVTAVDVVSQDNIEAVIEKAEVAGEIYSVAMEEALKETAELEGIRKDVAEDFLKDTIRVEDVEDMIGAAIDSLYSGKRASVDFSEIAERTVDGMADLFLQGMEEVYDVWRKGATPSVFTESFCDEMFHDMEQDFLAEYSEYQVPDLAELETAYDAKNGKGSFELLIKQEIENFKENELTDVKEEFLVEAEEVLEEVEKDVEDGINEAVQNEDVRTAFDIFREVGERSDAIKVFVYALIFGIVLFLLLFYMFDTPGFVVTSIPVIIGGIICKVVQFAEGAVFTIVEEAVAENSTGTKALDDLMRTLFDELLHPVFSNIGKFGTIMLIAGVALIGLAILRHVIKKQKQESEATFN